MAQQDFNIGTVPNDKTGDTYRGAFTKAQDNFDELYGFHFESNIIEIYQESDFPIQDGSTITISNGFGYFIKKPFATSKSFTMLGGVVFSVSASIPFITYTGAGVMFKADQAAMRLDNIVVSCPNAIAMQVTGDGTKTTSFNAVVSNLRVDDCIGVFNGINGGLLVATLCTFLGTFTSPAIALTGTGSALQSLNKVTIAGMATGVAAFDMGTTTITEVEISDLRAFGDAGAFAISGLANSANIDVGGQMTVIGSNFSAFTNPLSGVAVNDIRLFFAGNTGNISNSRNACDMFLTGGSETITTGIAGDWQEIGIPSVATWDSDIQDRFTVGTNGVMTYIGEEDIEAQLEGRATVEKVGGGSDILEVRFAVNWNGTVSDGGLAKSRAQTQNTDPTTVPIGALTSLSNGDNVRVIFSNTTGTSNIIASIASVEVTG